MFTLKHWLSASVCMLTLFAFPLVAHSTSVLTMSLFDMSQLSGALIEGTVVQVTEVPGSSTTIPATIYRLCNVQVHTGSASDKVKSGCIELGTAGGRDGTTYVDFVGSPVLQTGQHIIAFLDSEPVYITPFLGWWQGIFYTESTDDACVYGGSGNAVTHVDSSAIIRSVGFKKSPANPVAFGQGKDWYLSPEETMENGIIPPPPGTKCVTRKVFVDSLILSHALVAGSGASVAGALPKSWGPRTARSVPVSTPTIIGAKP